MATVDRVSFIRLTPRGPSLEEWLAVLAKKGFPVRHQDDPYFVQAADKKETKSKARLTKIDALNAALNSIRPGGVLGVPNFSHFAGLDVWFEVGRRLALKGCKVQCCETGALLDPTQGADIAQGAGMVHEAVNRRRGRAMTLKRVAAGVTGGRKKIALTGPKLREALALFADTEWSVPALADKYEMSPSTFLRRVKEATGIASKIEAITLLNKGEWPPAPKRRKSNVKTQDEE
jgi:hypothetical protein